MNKKFINSFLFLFQELSKSPAGMTYMRFIDI